MRDKQGESVGVTARYVHYTEVSDRLVLASVLFFSNNEFLHVPAGSIASQVSDVHIYVTAVLCYGNFSSLSFAPNIIFTCLSLCIL